MQLEVRRPERIVPSYSLTGDLLSYLRCRLQYRYYNRSELPPSRPVQLWFGEMLHGTLEMVYRYWRDEKDAGSTLPNFPWPCTQKELGPDAETPDWEEHDIGRFGYIVEEALRHQGKSPRSTDTRDAAYERIEAAVNQMGPHLFPLITSAEREVIATRPVPQSPETLRSENYEVHGRIDVLTNIFLSQAPSNNPIRQGVQEHCPGLEGDYEVIVDYKGTRRPTTDEPDWDQGQWQIQTYAWLRGRQPDALPVAAGILIYVNELIPGNEEMRSLKRAIEEGTTDVKPEPESADARLVRMWQPGTAATQLSLEFRLRRAIRIMTVTEESIAESLNAFDNVVLNIETDVFNESAGQPIQLAWGPDCKDNNTCVACDARWFCPKPANERGNANYSPKAPTAP